MMQLVVPDSLKEEILYGVHEGMYRAGVLIVVVVLLGKLLHHIIEPHYNQYE